MDDDKPNTGADKLPTIEVAEAPVEEKHHHLPNREKKEPTKPAVDIEVDEDEADDKEKEVAKPPKSGKVYQLKHWLSQKLTKKEFIAVVIILVVVIAGALVLEFSGKASAPTYTPPPAPKPIVYYSPLDGLPVTKAETTLPVTGVMIENSDFARPQSGLSEAGVIFEAIAEAGITRFLALYQEQNPPNLGPIRSVRPYYLQWALGFGAAIAHVGGSPQALQDIQTWDVKNLDQSFYGAYYHRITAREAPHNVYTSMADLRKLETSLGWTSDTFQGFPRQNAVPSKHPTATDLNFNISWSDYEIHYEYDAKDNAYLRWEAGVPQTDATTNKQLEPKVVIAMVLPYSLEADGYHSQYGTIGSGNAYVFQNGTVVTGKWTKTSRTAQISFTSHGQPIKLDRGQTWITALGSSSEVSYKD